MTLRVESDASDEDQTTDFKKRLFTGEAQTGTVNVHRTGQARPSGFMSATHAPEIAGGNAFDDHSSSLPRGEDESASQFFQAKGTPGRHPTSGAASVEGHHDDDFMDAWFSGSAPKGASGFQSAKALDVPAASRNELYFSNSSPPTTEAVPAFVGFKIGRAHV